ncbi:MAG: glycosyltransferase [Rickettsiales bacterium]|nr:glycosyltransferase [Rickettsiales bacterium]
MSQQKSIAIFAHNSKDAYSGGRYHAFIIALALVRAGFRVTLVTNNVPVFYDDFSNYKETESLKIHLVKSFKQKYLSQCFDIVFLVPGMDGYHNSNIYKLALRQKKQFGSKLFLLNFESPNWFNQYASQNRRESLWAGWKFVAKHSDMILSMTEEAVKYAKEYYDVDDVRHSYCYPSINNQAIQSLPDYPKEKNIICFYRRSHGSHKGGGVIKDLFVEEMRGYTVKLLCGLDLPDGRDYIKLLECANMFGIRIEVISRVSDIEKFTEYKKAKLLIFPSQFEGFGYPPVEALACNTECACYDLPVLRETCGKKLIYAKHSDINDLKDKIRKFLRKKSKKNQNYAAEFMQKYSLDSMSNKLDSIIRGLDTRKAIEVYPHIGDLEDIKFYLKSFALSRSRFSICSYRFLRYCVRRTNHLYHYYFYRPLSGQGYKKNLIGQAKSNANTSIQGLQNIYDSKRIFIIGNGPSVSYSDLEKLQNEICFCMNRFSMCYDKTSFRPDLTFVEDKLMIKSHINSILQNAQTRVIAPEMYTKEIEHESLIKFKLLPNPSGKNLSPDHNSGIYFGASVVYSAIQTAIWCGAKEIYLYGIDHSMNIPKTVDKKDSRIVIANNENNHFIKNYRDKNEGWCCPDYQMIDQSFDNAKKYADKNNIVIRNATRGGKLEVFERINLDDLFER